MSAVEKIIQTRIPAIDQAILDYAVGNDKPKILISLHPPPAEGLRILTVFPNSLLPQLLQES